MKTKLFTLIFMLAASVGTLFAESGTCGENLTWDLTDSVLTIRGTGAMTNFKWQGTPWYSYCFSIKSVSIDNGVSSIGEYAFSDCSGLTSINIPNGVTSIGQGAFIDCQGLTSVEIPNSVTSIGNYAFRGCSGLTSIEIPISITSIGEGTFASCSGLMSIKIPNSIIHIGEKAFYSCTGLTSIEIPNSVTKIGDYAFAGCSGLTNIIIPNSVTSIGDYAFYNCTGLTSIEIPNSVTSIGDYAFYNCTGLTSIEIPNSVTSIGNYAFRGCSGLTSPVYNAHIFAFMPTCYSGSYSIQDGIESILVEASYGCSSLTGIDIPNSITRIGEGAFLYCSNLTSITLPSSLSKIDNYVFFGCKSLKSMNIPNGVENIGEYAFSGCSNLVSVTIANTVTSIGKYAFGGCGLTSIILPNNITSIGEAAFYGCTSLDTVIWNARNYPDCTDIFTPFYQTIYPKFDLRSQITTFIIGDEVEKVPAYLCNGMTNLKTLSIGNSVKSIGTYAFAGLTNRKLNQVVLPNSLTTIGENAFSGDSYIESIYFGSDLEEIGQDAFKDCSRVGTMTCLSEVTPNVGTGALSSINSNAVLYVLGSCVQKYKVDENWNRFQIEPIGSTEVVEPGTEVTIEAGENTATFTWPTNTGAQTYSLIITKNGEKVCTLSFNANGQLVGLSFAPGKEESSHAHAALMTSAGMQFTVNGLSYATRYNYSLTVKDASSQILASYSGSFGTTNAPESTEAIDQITNDQLPVTNKVMRNGQIFILRGVKTYTPTGQEVK